MWIIQLPASRLKSPSKVSAQLSASESAACLLATSSSCAQDRASLALPLMRKAEHFSKHRINELLSDREFAELADMHYLSSSPADGSSIAASCFPVQSKKYRCNSNHEANHLCVCGCFQAIGLVQTAVNDLQTTLLVDSVAMQTRIEDCPRTKPGGNTEVFPSSSIYVIALPWLAGDNIYFFVLFTFTHMPKKQINSVLVVKQRKSECLHFRRSPRMLVFLSKVHL